MQVYEIMDGRLTKVGYKHQERVARMSRDFIKIHINAETFDSDMRRLANTRKRIKHWAILYADSVIPSKPQETFTADDIPF